MTDDIGDALLQLSQTWDVNLHCSHDPSGSVTFRLQVVRRIPVDIRTYTGADLRRVIAACCAGDPPGEVP